MNTSLRKAIHKSLFYAAAPRFSSGVGDLIGKHLERNSLKDAVRFEGQNKTWTYKEIDVCCSFQF
jgi:hypothetical protein